MWWSMPDTHNFCGCVESTDCCECNSIALGTHIVGSTWHRVHPWCLPPGHPNKTEPYVKSEAPKAPEEKKGSEHP